MFSSLRNHFGIPGVIAVVALVFAMIGGAYAASDNSGDVTASAKRQAKRGGGVAAQSKKFSKVFSKRFSKLFSQRFATPGPAGPQGPAGANGNDGANGQNGADGQNGTNGTDGADGLDGADGNSVILVNESPSSCPGEEGFTYEVEGSGAENEVCSSAGGGGGLPETLGSGETETGSWSLPAGSAGSTFAVSFPVPLAAELDESHWKYVPKEGTPPAECENEAHAGSASPANPEADPGYICVYAATGSIGSNLLAVRKSTADAFVGGGGASKAGAILLAGETVTGGGAGYFAGTWAVTAP